MGSKHLILDGFNLFHRAKSGFVGNHSVKFNFFRSLKSLITTFMPLDDVTIVLEGQPKRQQKLYKEYKANRPKSDDSFITEVDEIVFLLKKWFPINVIKHDDFEADDVIHNLVSAYGLENNSTVTIVSSDSDFTQLLQRNLHSKSLPTPSSIVIWNWQKKLYLMPPDYHYVKWKALRGDKTDNIQNCHRVGDSTAVKIIRDKNLFDKKMQIDSFKETYERNFKLIEFHDFSKKDREGLQIYRNTNGYDPEFKGIYKAFEAYEFKSLCSESTWPKWKLFLDSLYKSNKQGV